MSLEPVPSASSAVAGAEPHAFERRFQAEQVRLIVTQLGRLPLVMSAINFFIAWMIWKAQRPLLALLWLLVASTYDIWRFYICQQMLRTAGQDTGRQLRVLSLAFAGAALLRIVPTPVLFSLPLTDLQVMFTMVCVGLAAGGIATVGGVFWAYATWAGIVGVSLALAWALQGGFDRLSVGALVAMMFATLTLYARDQGRSLRQMMTLAYSNESLAASLRKERDRAELASQSKTRFFAAASHDLRQPLHALSINATTLELVAQRQPDPLMRELAGSIMRALRQSNGLLDALLDISQLDAQVVETHPVFIDAAALIEQLQEEFSPQAAQRGLTLAAIDTTQRQAWILSDDKQIRRLLGNLVSNALKFTVQGGVRLELSLPAGERVVIAVVDTGPGIAPQEHERVFEDFYQIGNPSRDRSRGLGLGLSIVRRTALLLGAQIRLRSALGGGSCFEVELPRAFPVGAAPLQPCANAPLPLLDLQLRVLALDDEQEILDSLGHLLPLLGCEIRCALDLPAALRAIEEGYDPELLLVDYRLRDVSGPDAIAALRKRTGALPAVMITGDTSPQDLRNALDASTLVVHKPIDGELLLRAMSDALSVHAASSGLATVDGSSACQVSAVPAAV